MPIQRYLSLLPALLSTILLWPLAPANGSAAPTEIVVPVADQNEISVSRYPADGEYLLLWLAPDYGFREAHRVLARRLPPQGIEVWQSNIAESLFLPDSNATYRAFDGAYVADLVAEAHRITGKKIALAGDAYAALPVLAGAREWQSRRHTGAYLIGAVLFTPYTYAATPPLGLAPDYMPIVDATNIPILVYQARNSANHHQFEEFLARLGMHGSPIYTRVIPEVMSLFYEQPATAAMLRQTESIPTTLRQLLPLLERHPIPAKVLPLPELQSAGSGIDVYLRKFQGNTRPMELVLDDVDGNRYTKRDFTGQVTLINFWASWCAPCVEEIPSLNRLQEQMAGRPFELVSINYAEERDTVAEFLRRVEVDFPVLMDVDGRYAEQWNVISYPSTFVIDRRGIVRYGVNAAIDWDDPELIERLESLME